PEATVTVVSAWAVVCAAVMAPAAPTAAIKALAAFFLIVITPCFCYLLSCAKFRTVFNLTRQNDGTVKTI
nr:hypothetical protein [Bifidobacterium bifidum]